MTADEVVAILALIGVEVHRTNAKGEINALCPEHEERTGRVDRHPDWWMNGATGAYICFSCGARGSLYQLLTKYGDDSMDIAEVRRKIVTAAPFVEEDDEPEEVVPEEDPVYEFWFNQLGYPGPKLREIRHLTLDAVQLHDVRFDRAHHCWVIPIREPVIGTLLGVQNKAKGWFRNRPESVKKSHTLFGWQVFTGKHAIMVESPLDVVRIESAGIRGAVAAYGSYVSDVQLDLLCQWQVGLTRVTLAFDNDEAGKEARDSVRERLRKRGLTEVRSVQYKMFDGAKDLGEIDDDETVREILQAAR